MLKRLVLVSALIATPAGAHSWYTSDCCATTDCAPVDEGVVVENQRTGAVTVLGQVLQRDDGRLRWSKDDLDHVCASGHSVIRCVYRRPRGM